MGGMGVYRFVIRIADFGPKQGGVFIRGGGVWYERDGLEVFYFTANTNLIK